MLIRNLIEFVRLCLAAKILVLFISIYTQELWIKIYSNIIFIFMFRTETLCLWKKLTLKASTLKNKERMLRDVETRD